jgi:hypothetical protein
VQTETGKERTQGRVQGSSGKLRQHFPKMPLEWKIQEYIRLLDAGWSRNYARAQAGLKQGRLDYEKAIKDKRVQAAHEKNRERFLEKLRGKLGK